MDGADTDPEALLPSEASLHARELSELLRPTCLSAASISVLDELENSVDGEMSFESLSLLCGIVFKMIWDLAVSLLTLTRFFTLLALLFPLTRIF